MQNFHFYQSRFQLKLRKISLCHQLRLILVFNLYIASICLTNFEIFSLKFTFKSSKLTMKILLHTYNKILIENFLN